MPTKHDGDGYTELLGHPDGAAHYGAWCALVGVAAKSQVRGTFLRDGGRPHDFESLSRMTKVAIKVLKAAIPRLLQIGWLEELADTAPSCGIAAGSCDETAASRARATQQDKTEQDTTEHGTEGNGTELVVDLFEVFWMAYPSGRKGAKGKAREAWQKAIKKVHPQKIIAATREYAESDVGNGQYVKGPAVWLNGECWDDDRASWRQQADPRGNLALLRKYTNGEQTED